MADCPDSLALIEGEIDKVRTQYRESPKLLGLIRGMLGQVTDIIDVVCQIPTFFDLDSAVGDQLTILGKALGWPRCHCVCITPPLYGFDCGSNPLGLEIVGFCETGSWINCGESSVTDICFADDEMYRAFLKARRYQVLSLYDINSLQLAARHIWGSTTNVFTIQPGQVIVAPGRNLSSTEMTFLPLAFRILPIAPGIKPMIRFGADVISGFGTGFGGLCDSSTWMCPEDPHPYDCAA